MLFSSLGEEAAGAWGADVAIMVVAESVSDCCEVQRILAKFLPADPFALRDF